MDQEHSTVAALLEARDRRADLYAIIDAARDPPAPAHARQSGEPCESLFAGSVGEQLEEVAPYLVKLSSGSTFWNWWFGQWGNSVGVMVEAPVGLPQLRSHLRTLLIVHGRDRQKHYFRFYDPRVLRPFLSNCTGPEVSRFFGPITAIHCEGTQGQELLTFRPEHDGVSVQRRPVVDIGGGARG